MNELVAETDAGGERKRVMTPAIENMTVKEERACLSEIRKLGAEADHQHILSNGWSTGKFALMYVTGQHVKRKTKTKKENRSSPLSRKPS
ncbi:unnamed protein product [Ectocarpus sp. 12 AP-2014]